MGNFLKNRVALSIFFFSFGMLTFWSLQKVFFKDIEQNRSRDARTQTDQLFNSFLNEGFFDHSREPFEEMQRMQKEMLGLFESHQHSEDAFNSWYKNKFGGGSPGEIKRGEDADFVYYDLEFLDGVPHELKVEVVEQQLNISGKIQNQIENEGNKTMLESNFHRSLPVPFGVEADKFQLDQSDKKISIKFPKIKT